MDGLYDDAVNTASGWFDWLMPKVDAATSAATGVTDAWMAKARELKSLAPRFMAAYDALPALQARVAKSPALKAEADALASKGQTIRSTIAGIVKMYDTVINAGRGLLSGESLEGLGIAPLVYASIATLSASIAAMTYVITGYEKLKLTADMMDKEQAALKYQVDLAAKAGATPTEQKALAQKLAGEANQRIEDARNKGIFGGASDAMGMLLKVMLVGAVLYYGAPYIKIDR
ncbi:MAG: hypothetical protein ACRERV_13025 [Methylococcales bacterium]